MSLLNSKFDIVTVDNPVALAALAQVLEVASPPSPNLDANGTPVAGTIAPGAVVKMDANGKAVLATTGDLDATAPVLPFVVLEGNTDYSGRFVQKLTVLAGGFTMKTDQYDVAGQYAKGSPVTFSAGKVAQRTLATQQIIGFVGPGGLDTTNGVLEVICPQGLTR